MAQPFRVYTHEEDESHEEDVDRKLAHLGDQLEGLRMQIERMERGSRSTEKSEESYGWLVPALAGSGAGFVLAKLLEGDGDSDDKSADQTGSLDLNNLLESLLLPAAIFIGTIALSDRLDEDSPVRDTFNALGAGVAGRILVDNLKKD